METEVKNIPAYSGIVSAVANGGALYLLGALDALESVAAPRSSIFIPGGNGRACALACAPSPAADPDDTSGVDNLLDIETALDAARKKDDFKRFRVEVKAKIWEVGIKRDLVDRITAAIVCGFVTPATFTRIVANLEGFRKNNPTFVGYSYLSNRFRAVYLAAGFNWPPISGGFEPELRRNPNAKTRAEITIEKIEKDKEK